MSLPYEFIGADNSTQLILLNPSHADSGTNTECTFIFPRTLHGHLSLVSAMIPYTQQNIISGFNHILIINSTTYTLTPGCYTQAEFISHVNTVCAAIAGFALSYNSITNKYTISATGAITISGSNTSTRTLTYQNLGFEQAADYSSATSITAESYGDHCVDESYYVTIREASNNFIPLNPTNAPGFVVPLNANKGGIATYNVNSGFSQIVSIISSANLTVSISTENGPCVGLSEWTLILRYHPM